MIEGPVKPSILPGVPGSAALAFQTELTSSALNVRQAVIDLRDSLMLLRFDDDTAGSVELAAAEALNNIAEHAYCGSADGTIEMTAYVDGSALYLSIIDEGKPIASAELPEGAVPEIPENRSDLPEGGFGWSIIRQLCDDVQYHRQNNRNALLIRFARHQN